MSLREHRLLRHFLRWADAYRAGYLDAEGLAQNLSGLMSALEGDVPFEIRDALRAADGTLDSLRFIVAPEQERAAVEAELQNLERIIDSYSA